MTHFTSRSSALPLPGRFGARLAGILLALVALALSVPEARAVTYANTTVAFSWIDPSTHTKVGYNTAPYKFNGGGGCGTTPPTLDDTLSDAIPIGFTFMYGGVNYTTARIMSNGRLQFGGTDCGYGSPVTQLPYPYTADTGLNYSMRIYGNDLDPTAKSEVAGYSTVCLDRTTCYVSYATLGTAPYRQFVVSWVGVPEWASGGSTSGNYNMQIILQENGEFIYQYGSMSAGPGNTTAQVGWQIDGNDYDVPSMGFPGSNTAIKFYIPRPVAEYRMEQLSWNGTAGEVLDTSGNGNHGVRVGSAQTTASGRVCRGAAIPGNTNLGTIDAVNTGIAVPTALGGAGTITFWYKPNNWASNGNQDAQLFDATTASPNWFFLVKRGISSSAVRLRFVIRDSAGNDRVAETGNLSNTVLNGGWVHIGVSWNFNNLAGANPDHLRIYVNGVQSTQLAFGVAGTVAAGIGTLYVGDNRSGDIGQSGTARSADGTIDEFRAYNYEGGVALVQRDMNQTGTCVNHYAITLSGSPSACPTAQPVQVTVTAHDAANNPVVMPNNTTQIALYVSSSATPSAAPAAMANGGDWSLANGYGAFSNGAANDGMATYLFNGEYQVVLNYQPTVSGDVYAHVTDGQLVESENSVISVPSCAPASFNAFELPAGVASCAALPVATVSGPIKTKISGTTYPLCVVAIDSPPQIKTSFNGNVKLEVVGNYNTGVTLDGNNCPTTSTVLDSIASTALTNGKASVTFNAVPNAWRDVRVRISYPTTSPTVTRCSLDNYAMRPNSLGFTVTDADWASAGTTRTLGNVTTPGGTVHKAGQPFTITATAYNGAASPAVTTNYVGTPTASVAAYLIPTACLNGTACSLGSGTFAAGATSGSVVSSTASYAEVGAFNMQLTDTSFASVDAADSSTAERYVTSGTVAVGRFVPDHFTLASGSVTPACTLGGSALSYMDQPFTVAATLEARNAAEGKTQNYDPSSSGYAPATIAWQAENANNGTNLGTRLANVGAAWSRGAYAVNSATATFSRGASPDGPYDSLQLGVQLSDPDGPVLNGLDMNAATSGACSPCTAKTVDAPKSVRYGRLRLANAYGSELLPLRVPVSAEYFRGAAGNWAVNGADNCTALAANFVAMGNYTGAVNGANMGTSHLTAPANLGSGTGYISVAPPTCAVPPCPTGGFDLALTLGSSGTGSSCPTPAIVSTSFANLPWLQYTWCAGKTDPNAHATFGTGKNRFIYLRERY